MATKKETRITIDITLGAYMKKLRIGKNYSQKEMSEILDMTQTMVGYIEKGERLPTMQTLLDYATHFSLDVKKLVEKRIITVENTVNTHGDKTPHHIMNEYHLIAYYTLLI